MDNENNKSNQPPKIVLVICIVLATTLSIYSLFKVNNNMNNTINTTNKVADKTKFNTKYENNMGTQFGTFVLTVLDDVITNNNKNNNHIITIIYENRITNNPQSITNIKKNIKSSAKYEVTPYYDEKGFVNKIRIEIIQ